MWPAVVLVACLGRAGDSAAVSPALPAEGARADAGLGAGTPEREAATPDAGARGASAVRRTVRRAGVELGVEVRPEEVAPGGVFVLDLTGPVQAASARVAGRAAAFYDAGPGWLRAFAGVPVDTPPGAFAVEVDVETAEGGHEELTAVLTVGAVSVPESQLTVASRFVKPSPPARARMRADGVAFEKAYELPFGPPLFTDTFVNPREGAEVNAPFGQKRMFNGRLQSRHWGMDLDGKVGDPVAAANDGVVRMARDCYTSGNSVLVAHGAGVFTAYFHLDKMRVRAGDRVKRGQIVGLVGKTGRVTGPHLHLAAKVMGRLADPESLFGIDLSPPLAAGMIDEEE